VWIVDPATKTVELHTSTGRRAVEGDEALRSAVVEGFEVVPNVLFAPSCHRGVARSAPPCP
jgi:hypothetical protein